MRSVLESLQQERSAEQEEFRREWLELSLSRRRALGVTLFPLEFVEASGTLGERWKLRFRINADSPGPAPAQKFGRGHRFHAGQVVDLFRTGADGESKEREVLSGVLGEVRADRLVVIADDAPDWLEDGRIGMNLAFNETTYREMERALRAVIDDGKVARRRDRLLAYAPANQLNVPDEPVLDSKLNPAQARAVQGVMALSAGDFAVIHGPPGTGKTTTVVGAIVALLRRGEKVLVTAPTNAAVDLLAERLLEAFIDPAADKPNEQERSRMNLLRLGHPARVSETIWRHTLEGSVDAHPDAKTTIRYRAEADELYKKARKYRRKFGPAERAERQAMLKEHSELRKLIRSMEQGIIRHIVQNADVVVTTLVGATSNRIRDLEFDCVVIDEATQALEPAAWIPILRAEKLVMAGDHRQLPPTVKAAFALSNTLFEKVISRHADADCIFFLDTQYRMDPAIVAFSNQAFYNDRLITHESVLQRDASTTIEHDSGPEWISPLVFIDTAGCDFSEEQDPDEESYRNSGEGRLLAAILAAQAPVCAENGWSVGVIATYRNQVTHLRETLAAATENSEISGEMKFEMEIDTVDAFQGREHDLVCISMVRSNDAGETGFLGETRRMNVALTRARRLLIVVGDSSTLASHPFYERFLKHVDQHGDYRSAYEFLEIV